MPSEVRNSRLARVDALRFLCILWVIWIHLVESEQLRATLGFVRFRMPVFVILSIFFLLVSEERHPQRTFVQYIRERFKNLYVPFLAWAAIYYVLDGVVAVTLRQEAWPWPSKGILIHGGPSLHLWFVPFIAVAGIAVFPIGRQLLRFSSRGLLIGTAALGMGIVLAAMAGPSVTDVLIDYTFPTNIKSLMWRVVTLAPCIPLGIAAYFFHRKEGYASRLLSFLGLGVFGAALFAGIIVGHHPVTDSLAGLGLVFFALSPVQGRLSHVVGAWGPYSFGMYLCHMLFVDGLHLLRQHVLHMEPVWWFDIGGVIVAAAGTVGLTLLVSRWRGLRWLMPPSPGAGVAVEEKGKVLAGSSVGSGVVR